MLELARDTPGFISFKAFQAEDGERLSFIEFEDHASVLAWKSHPEHAAAQARGKASYYAEYRVQACDVVRSYAFSRDPRDPQNPVPHP